MSGQPEPWQVELDFPDRVRRSVEPILRRFDMFPTETDAARVRYENEKVFIEIKHRPYEGEVAIEFGRLHEDERLSFPLYLRWKEPASPAATTDGVAWTGPEVDQILNLYADALQRHGPLLLRGDEMTYEAMKRIRWWDVTPGATKELE